MYLFAACNDDDDDYDNDAYVLSFFLSFFLHKIKLAV